MKNNNIIPVLVVIVLLFAAFSNPGIDRQKELVKEKMMEGIQQMSDNYITASDNGLGKGSEKLGLMLQKSSVNRLVETSVGRKNYGLFSLTTLTWRAKPEIIGIGVFGTIFYSTKFDDLINQGLLFNIE